MSERSATDRQLWSTCLVILTLIACGAALSFLRSVVVPFLLAVVVVYALRPMIEWEQSRLWMPRWLAVVGVGLLALAILAGVGLVVAAFVVKLRENLPLYEAQMRQFTERLTARIDLERWGIDIESLRSIPELGSRQLLGAVLSSGAELLSSIGLVLLFVIFMLSGTAVKKAPSPMRTRIDTAVRSYILNMIGLSALAGILVGITLQALGVDFAIEFGVLAFLLNFIPTVGSIIATILPLPVVLLSPQLGLTEKVLAIALPAAIQVLLGSLIQPRVIGRSQDLHPVAVLLAMVFFGTIWGVTGAVLAAPIAGVLRIVFAHIPATRPIADLLAGGTGSATPEPAAAIG